MSEKIISTNILSVEIEDIPFYSSNGIETSKRAIINLNLPMKVENRVLGFIDNNEIYKKIQSGENIVLDECFVFNHYCPR